MNGGLTYESAGGGISLSTGSDGYEVSNNLVCGNYTMGDGGGIGHFGLSDNGTISFNHVFFNQSVNMSVTHHGGGILISGEPAEPGALTLGSGNVVVDANFVMGNNAGAGSGGGIRTQWANGIDLATSPWVLSLTNNMIVDNVATWAGGGISLQDTVYASIVNNTIANNDSTATLGSLLSSGQTPAQPAGIAAERHGPDLAAALGDPGGFSNPTIINTIVWHNRAFHYDASQGPPLVPHLAPVTVGECAPGADYWDLGVVGEPFANPLVRLDPTYSILSPNATGYDVTNLYGDPDFLNEYCNGSRSLSEPWGPMLATAAFGEGGNFIDLRYGPLTQNWPVGGPPWSYGVGSASAALGNAYPAAAVAHDFKSLPRPQGALFEIGADEVDEDEVPEPGLVVGLGAGILLLGLLADRRRARAS
jgi:parallel beta-helix repeat protein